MSDFSSKALQFRHQFLRERGTSGGTQAEFQEWLMRHLQDLVALKSANEAVIELAASVWRKKSRPKDSRQQEIMFAGEPLPYILRFKGDEGQDISVLAEHATIWQFAGHIEIKAVNKQRIDQAYEKARAAYELALARAGGDMFASLSSLQDGVADDAA